MLPLLGFADRVQSIAATGIDLVGLGDLTIPNVLAEYLAGFDSIVSWYGANRPEFREALAKLPVEFLQALPPEEFTGHAADFFCRQVGAPEGAVPVLRYKPTGLRGTAVLHPFSGSPRKNWPMTSFHTLAGRLPWPVEWTAGPEDDLPAATRFTDLGELAHWLAGAELYLGNDSGITHLAAALGVRTVALFGPTDPRKWAPRGPNVTVLEGHPLAELTPDEVFRRLDLSPQFSFRK